MEIKYSDEMRYALEEARNIAVYYHSPNVGTEHVMVAILRFPGESMTKTLFNIYRVDMDVLRTKIEELIENNEHKTESSPETIRMNIQTDNTLRLA